MYDYKNIAIYYDSEKRLIGVPCGKPDMYDGCSSLDIFLVLEPGYSDNDLEKFFHELLDACYSAVPIPEGMTAIQKYTGAKSYVAATKGYQLMEMDWEKDKGYVFTPMKVDKRHKGAFEGISGITINVSHSNKHRPIDKGALALAFRTALLVTAEQE